MTTSPVQPGDILAEKYRVERVLGVGGMGVVVAATHIELGERVALKFLLPELVDRQEIVARFLREAQAAVRIRSEHVARISDVGRLPSGAPYMVMEYLAGRDLAEVIARQGPLPVETTIEWVLQACEAIAEAHSLGIVHRDLKPSNLFLTRRADGSHLVKVLDFGISKTSNAGPKEAALTTTNTTMGSPLYMSPEQVRSAKNVDARADVWSLGVILHELLTGKPPFEAETTTAILAAVIADTPTSLRRVLPDAPPGLERVLMQCMEKRVEDRPVSVAALAEALAPFAPPSARVSIERIGNVLRGASVVNHPLLSSDHTLLSSGPDARALLPPNTRESQHDGSRAPGGTLNANNTDLPEGGATRGTWGQTTPIVPPAPTQPPTPHRPLGAILAVGAVALALGIGASVLRTGSPPQEDKAQAPAASGSAPVSAVDSAAVSSATGPALPPSSAPGIPAVTPAEMVSALAATAPRPAGVAKPGVQVSPAPSAPPAAPTTAAKRKREDDRTSW